MNYIDMISKLGIGNAHPGGFAATLAQLERYPLRSGDHVLEVGSVREERRVTWL